MSIIKFELEKVFKNRLLLWFSSLVIIVVLGGLISAFFYNHASLRLAPDHESFGREVVQRNLDYMDSFAGELTDERIEMILTQKIEEIKSDAIKGRNFFGLLPGYVAETFIKDYDDIYGAIDMAEKNGEDLQLSDFTVYSLKDLNFYGSNSESTDEAKLKIGNFVTWDALFEVMDSCFVPVALVIILITATLFSSEFSNGTLPLLYTTKYGRTKLIRGKLWTSLIVTFLLFTVVQIIVFSAFCYFFSLNGWDVSIQTNFNWQIYDFPLVLNNLQVFFLGYGFQLAALLTVASVTCLISSATKNPFSSLAVALTLYFAPQLGHNMIYDPANSLVTKIFKLFPANNYKIGEMLATLRSDETFFFDGFLPNLFFLLALWLGTKISADCFVYFRMKHLSLT